MRTTKKNGTRGSVGGAPSAPPTLRAPTSVAFTTEERGILAQAAQLQDRRLGEYIRRTVLAVARQEIAGVKS